MSTALIQEIGTVSGNQMRMSRLIEDAHQTFLAGTPVMLFTNGGLRAWDGSTVINGIAGIAKDFGANLATAGVALGTQMTPGDIPPDGGGISFGSVPNMPAAVNLLRPYFNDGRTGIVLVIPDTLFFGQVGPGQAQPTVADIGKSFGLTKDTDNHWYVDRTKTGAGVAVVEITGLPKWDVKRGVLFQFLSAVAQISC